MAKKQRYHVRNWSKYNRSLKERGSITFWISPEFLKSWYKTKRSGKKGRPSKYGDAAIMCMLTVKMVFKLPLRAMQGMIGSIIKLLKIEVEAADYTTVSRRQKQLKVPLKKSKKEEAIHVVVDATGLKVFGEGEWKVRQHGYSKRRTWRKIHLGIDEATGEIVARELTGNDCSDGEMLPDLLKQVDGDLSQVSGDGAYDTMNNHELVKQRGARSTIPPHRGAKIRQHKNSHAPPIARDEVIRDMRDLGRAEWKKQRGYHRRSLAETAIFRFKTAFSDHLSARLFENQITEAFIKCNILNQMTSLDMPDSYVVA